MKSIAKLTTITCLLIVPALLFARAGEEKSFTPGEMGQIERGKYVTVITGCNDCHTPGYAESDGKSPVERWLTGNKLGFRGPWGTTYATNLRLLFQTLSEDQWVVMAKGLKTRPPMPWFSVNAMAEDDLRAMHKFVRSLGPAGEAAPQALAPGEHPSTPSVDWPMPNK